MSDKNKIPHLVLDWNFNIPTQELTVSITDALSYSAINGGRDGFIKTFEGETTTVTLEEWDNVEKHWISANYGAHVGMFQPDHDRKVPHPTLPRDDDAPMGVGPDGLYLDHMQRRQCVLDGHDQAIIGYGKDGTLYTTIDKGATIFKRVAHRNVLYGELEDPEFDDFKWVDHSQPCLQQPWAEGVKLSSHEEMRTDGVRSIDVERCMKGKWVEAPRPELQELYTYPTK